MPATRGRGRPPFKPTAAQRMQVSVGAAGGITHDGLAQALDINVDTLRKHFAAELSTGASKRRLAWLLAMDKAARGGNVAAQKALLSTSPTMDAPAFKPAEPAAETVAPAPKALKLGKKEQQAADAVDAQAGTDWNDLLPRGSVPLLQ